MEVRLLDLRRSGPSHTAKVNLKSDRSTVVHNIELPPLSQLVLEVLKNLPPQIISKMNEMYKGELQGPVDTLNSDKGKENSSKSLALPSVTCDSVPDDEKLQGYRDHKDSMHSEEEHTKVSFVNASCSRASALAEKTTKSVTQLDLMPDSLCQADLKVLQELPEDVKVDLFSALPLHRSGDPACSTSNVSESKSLNVVRAEKRSPRSDDPENPRTFLPPGSSQKWIEQFGVSSCLILNVIAEQQTDFRCERPLSSVIIMQKND